MSASPRPRPPTRLALGAARPLLRGRFVKRGSLTRSFLAAGALGGVVLALVLALLTGHEAHSELFEERERVLLLVERELARRGADAASLSQHLPGLRAAFGLESLVVFDQEGRTLGQDPPRSAPAHVQARAAIAGASGPGEEHLIGGLDPPRYSELFGVGQAREGELLRTTVPLRLVGRPSAFLMGSQRVDDLLPEAIGAGAEVALYALLGVGLLLGTLTLWVRAAERIIAQRTDALTRQGDELALANAQLSQLAQNLEVLVDDRTRRLLQAETLARLGRLSAGVAHEINNPLAAISTSAEMLLRDLDDPALSPEDPELQAALREYLALIRDEAFRVEGIARDLLDFSRSSTKRRVETGPLDARALLAGTERLLRHRANQEGKSLELVGPEQLEVLGDSDTLRQLTLNLTLNALQATPPGGRIRWRLERVGSERVALSCEDEGPGFSPEALEHALDPFYTEQEVGRGTGLGLSIVYGIVQEHGGALRLENRAEGGARVAARAYRALV
ncbi:MAG TPA: hypothetical protein DEA08_26375, partial [Planctomycetes bacterium]|nr:hypothetical protein [Planctomycetota bacterium]